MFCSRSCLSDYLVRESFNSRPDSDYVHHGGPSISRCCNSLVRSQPRRWFDPVQPVATVGIVMSRRKHGSAHRAKDFHFTREVIREARTYETRLHKFVRSRPSPVEAASIQYHGPHGPD